MEYSEKLIVNIHETLAMKWDFHRLGLNGVTYENYSKSMDRFVSNISMADVKKLNRISDLDGFVSYLVSKLNKPKASRYFG